MADSHYAKTQGLKGEEEDSQLWQERYRLAYTNQLPLFKRFADWYDGMYTIVNSKNYALWRSKVYLPILAAKAWNLIAKFISLRPGFEVRPRPSGIDKVDLDLPGALEDAAEKAQLLLEYDYDNPHLTRPIREKLEAVLMDTVVTGTGIAKVPWTVCKEEKYKHPVSKSGEIDMTSQEKTTTAKGYNDLIPVNVFNVFVAPASTDLYTAPWIIIKEWKTMEQLEKINKDKGVEVYKNLDQLGNARATGDPLAIYKKSRNRLTVQYDPIVADRTVDFIELYECYEGQNITTYANAGRGGGSNWVEIRKVTGAYWHGKYPLVRFLVKQRPFDFWGEGIWETNHRLQVAANDIFNHYLDNWDLSVDGMLMAQESAGINDYVVEPGGLVTYRTEKPEQFKFPEPNPVSLENVMNQLMEAIENNSISNYSSGTPDDNTDKTRGTKGGILAIQNAADDMTAFMRANFQETIKTVGQMWMSNNRQFMFQDENLSVIKNHQMTQTTVQPQDLQFDMELRVDEASMLPITDDQLKADYQAYVTQLTGLQQASMAQHTALGTPALALDFGAIVEELGENSGFRNTRKLIGQAPQGTSPVQAGQMADMASKIAKAQPQPQGPQQNPQDKMMEQINYKDAPPDIQRQMEQQAGMQPSRQQGPNPNDPVTANADKQTFQLAHELHAKGKLHPAVLNMVRQHLGHSPVPMQPTAPIGEPPPPPQPEPAGAPA